MNFGESQLNRNAIIRGLIFVLLAVLITLFYLDVLSLGNWGESLYSQISLKVADTVIVIAKSVGLETPSIDGTDLLCIGQRCQKVILPEGAFFPYLIGFTSLFVLLYNSIVFATLVTISSFTFLLLRAAVITTINLYFKGEAHYMLLLLLETMVYWPMVFIIYSILNKYELIKPLYLKFETRFKERFDVASYSLVMLVLIVPTLPRIIIRYLDKNLLSSILNWNLSLSAWLVDTFTMYPTLLDGKYLFIGKNWISLEGPCLGTGVMSIVIILITTFKSPIINKALYSILFVCAFLGMNAVRLAVLLVYIYEKSQVKTLDKTLLHDQVTYAMYVFALAAFIFYVVKVSELNLRRR